MVIKQILLIIIITCGLIYVKDVYAFNSRLLIEWGWGSPASWKGFVSVEKGTLIKAMPIGIEPGEKGITRVSDRSVEFESETAGLTDSISITLNADFNSILNMEIGKVKKAICLNQIFDGKKVTIKSEDHRIVIKRDPKDLLRLVPSNKSMVLIPGEPLFVQLESNIIQEHAIGKDKIGLFLDDKPIKTLEFKPGNFIKANSKFSVNAPNAEGAHYLKARGLSPELNAIETTLQFMVIDPLKSAKRDNKEIITSLVDKYDPEIKTSRKIYKGQGTKIERHMGIDYLETSHRAQPASISSKEQYHMGWFAVELKVNNPGIAHILEIDHLPRSWQTVGVSIIEPNAKGSIGTGQLDVGFNVRGDYKAFSNDSTYSICFWPKTRSPLVLITNRNPKNTASIKEIRLKEVIGGLPPLKDKKEMPSHVSLVQDNFPRFRLLRQIFLP